MGDKLQVPFVQGGGKDAPQAWVRNLASLGMKRGWSTLVLSLLCWLSGCAAASSAAGMTYRGTLPPAGPSQFANALQVGDVEGGRDTDPMGASQVGNEELRAALVASLQAYGLLAQAGSGGLRLRAVVAELVQPVAGFTFTVTATIHYTIQDERGHVFFDDTVISDASASTRDAFYGVKRLRLATEGAIRANIGKLIVRLRARQPAAAGSASSASRS